MIVRPARIEDIPRIVEMGGHFFASTSYAQLAPFDPAAAAALATFLVERGVLLVADINGRAIGMVGLALAPMPFNQSVTFAHEVMWWVEPDARHSGAGAALLRAVPVACKERGADVVQMVHLANSPPQAAMLYQRGGYEHTESSYTKRLH